MEIISSVYIDQNMWDRIEVELMEGVGDQNNAISNVETIGDLAAGLI